MCLQKIKHNNNWTIKFLKRATYIRYVTKPKYVQISMENSSDYFSQWILWKKDIELISRQHFSYDFLMKTFFFILHKIGQISLYSLFYKHTRQLGGSSICLRFCQSEPEIMLDGMLINFKTHFMVCYCVWYKHCNGLF